MMLLATAFALVASSGSQTQAAETAKKPLIALEAEEDAAALLEEADEIELDEIVFDDEVSDFDEANDEE